MKDDPFKKTLEFCFPRELADKLISATPKEIDVSTGKLYEILMDYNLQLNQAIKDFEMTNPDAIENHLSNIPNDKMQKYLMDGISELISFYELTSRENPFFVRFMLYFVNIYNDLNRQIGTDRIYYILNINELDDFFDKIAYHSGNIVNMIQGDQFTTRIKYIISTADKAIEYYMGKILYELCLCYNETKLEKKPLGNLKKILSKYDDVKLFLPFLFCEAIYDLRNAIAHSDYKINHVDEVLIINIKTGKETIYTCDQIIKMINKLQFIYCGYLSAKSLLLVLIEYGIPYKLKVLCIL